MDPSGIRLGMPALTTRGCVERDMHTVAELVDEALANRTDDAKLSVLKEKVREFSLQFPVPGIE